MVIGYSTCGVAVLIRRASSTMHGTRMPKEVSNSKPLKNKISPPKASMSASSTMHGTRMPKEVSNSKPLKNKISPPKASMYQLEASNVKGIEDVLQPSSKAGKMKRGLRNELSPVVQPPWKSANVSVPDSSATINEYRPLRRKYLLLEEESFMVGKKLKEVEDEVKTLEEEKLTLLDQLVVLEGLIDPSELEPQL
ncbi:hypothetical protein RJ641_036193 [Dillenia turbinata]|uniref:Uncharacterized protein n=1 Tax=Dillenia turbinata TaxID=194707 RepID=A0AAN8ZAS2_9MAGN